MAHHLSQQPQNPSEPPALVLPSAPLQHRSSSITSLAAHQHHQRSSPLKQLMQQQAERSSSAFWALSPGSGSKPLVHSDRFIPSRTSSARLDFSVLERELVTSDVSRNAADREDIDPAYHLLLRSELLGAASGPIPADKAQQLQQLRSPCSPAKGLFRYMSGDHASPAGGPRAPSPFATLPLSREPWGGGGGGGAGDAGSPLASPARAPRKIPRAPFKVLDAPALQDDFYLNLLDWSSQNFVAVGLGTCVYLWSAATSKVTKLCDLAPADSVASVSWSARGTYLAVGCATGHVQVWDVARGTVVQTLEGHRARVGALAWGGSVLCSGSRDRLILARDLRQPQGSVAARLVGHRSEVCGLKWSPDGRQLASGGNDNQLCVWQLNAGGASSTGPSSHLAGTPPRAPHAAHARHASLASPIIPSLFAHAPPRASLHATSAAAAAAAAAAAQLPPRSASLQSYQSTDTMAMDVARSHSQPEQQQADDQQATDMETDAVPAAAGGAGLRPGVATPQRGVGALLLGQLAAAAAAAAGGQPGAAAAPTGSHGTGGISPVLRFTDHQAAVKALAWSPHQHGLLASGGGTADRCIRFWNTTSGAAVNCVDTGSQVCNLYWSRNVNELVSTHGYSQNQVVVWKCPSMAKLATLTGHTLRVLYLSMSPDGQTIVTGAGDETLRFWSVFPGGPAGGRGGAGAGGGGLLESGGLAGLSRASIR